MLVQTRLKQIGPYKIDELLGMGSMGAVYRAYQRTLNRHVAIKLLPPALALEEDYLKRFNQEAQIIAQLEHPHIVPIYDFGIDNESGASYIVMRLFTGGSLSDQLRTHEIQGKAPSLKDVSALLWQLASGLDYAHGKGIIHRDLKPDNILFDDLGNAFLVDFGIAKLLNATVHLTGEGVAFGTPNYMAPEQWLDKEVTPATDQYALGVMLYSILTGNLPFEAETTYALMKKHISDVAPMPHTLRPGVPVAVSVVLNRAMAKDPATRFPNITSFAQEFEIAIHKTEEQPVPLLDSPNSGAPVMGRTLPMQSLALVPPEIEANSEEIHDRFKRETSLSKNILLAGSLLALALLYPAIRSINSPAYPEVSSALTLPTGVPENNVIIPSATITPSPTLTASPTPTETATPSPIPSSTATNTPVPPSNTPRPLRVIVPTLPVKVVPTLHAILPTAVPPTTVPLLSPLIQPTSVPQLPLPTVHLPLP